VGAPQPIATIINYQEWYKCSILAMFNNYFTRIFINTVPYGTA
jgi:hypothetical protein